MNRLRARLHRLKGRRDSAAARQRRVLRWYLGLHDRWSIEAELGRPPVYGAVRECFAEREAEHLVPRAPQRRHG